jgi:hypothetical protein
MVTHGRCRDVETCSYAFSALVAQSRRGTNHPPPPHATGPDLLTRAVVPKKDQTATSCGGFWGNNPFARSNMDTTSGPLRSKGYIEKWPPVSISIEEVA